MALPPKQYVLVHAFHPVHKGGRYFAFTGFNPMREATPEEIEACKHMIAARELHPERIYTKNDAVWVDLTPVPINLSDVVLPYL